MNTKYIISALFIFLMEAPEAQNQPGIKLVQFAAGLQRPVDIKNSGDQRLFVVEQAGIVKIVDSTGSVKNAPFLDITDRVKSTGAEQGLLGIAFHPQYPTNGYFYVDYTGNGDSVHISRFSVSPANPDSALVSSEFKLLTIYKPYINHNGGDLNFGHDGYLYIGTGDGGGAGDPGNRAQDLMQYLGKILRIDVDHGNPYAIPESNPFKYTAMALGEIWALGLRNPWRFSFDLLTHDLWIADVGQNKYEEIDFQPAQSTGGENYGWRCFEGNSIYDTTGCKPSADYTFPVFAFPHNAGDPCNSVTGGYRYRGSKFIDLSGYYFFSDYCTDDIWTLHDSAGKWTLYYMGKYPGNNFCTFGTDVKDELYLAGRMSGIIYRIADSTAGIEDNACRDFKLYPNPFSAILTIEIQKCLTGEAQFVIMDLQGRQICTGRTFLHSIDIDLGHLMNGIYILNLEINEKQIYRKIIKQ